jgi:hypothetical protein
LRTGSGLATRLRSGKRRRSEAGRLATYKVWFLLKNVRRCRGHQFAGDLARHNPEIVIEGWADDKRLKEICALAPSFCVMRGIAARNAEAMLQPKRTV